MSGDNPNPGQQAPPAQESRGGRNYQFTVEFGCDYNRNFTITCPPFQGVDIRGRYDTSRMAKRPMGMRDLGSEATRIPSPIPGAMLRIDVRRSTATLFDPLAETTEGKEILRRYNELAKRVPALRQMSPFESLTYKLDPDQLKTLLCDLLRKLESGDITVIDGRMPELDELDNIPGHELYDPGNNSHDKPRYKKDLPSFIDKMRAAGV